MKVMDGGEVVANTADADPPEPLTVQEQATQSIEETCLALYVQYGTLAEVSRRTGIKYAELQKLSRTIWWNDEVARMKKDNASQEVAMQTRLLDKSLEMLMDRLEHGDLVAGKAGKLYRKPLAATDIARIAHTVFTERQLLRNEPTAIAGETGKVQVLADKLRALGAKDITIIEEDGHAQEAS